MPSIPAIARALGASVLTVGLLVGGFGAVQAVTDDCRSGDGLALNRLDPGETAEPSFEPIAYETLTERERAVFTESLERDSPPIYPDEPAIEALGGTVITYEGARYEVVQFVADCAKSWVGLLFSGVALAAAGAVVVGTSHAWLGLRA